MGNFSFTYSPSPASKKFCKSCLPRETFVAVGSPRSNKITKVRGSEQQESTADLTPFLLDISFGSFSYRPHFAPKRDV